MSKVVCKRILVVEDDEDTAMLLAETFQERGHEVDVAHDGLSALSVAERFKPSVVVLDIGLPHMDGYELARRLRQLGMLPAELRVLALSGYERDHAPAPSCDASFDAYLIKPVQSDVLMRAVEHTEPNASLLNALDVEEQR